MTTEEQPRRKMPANLDAERAVIGAVLIDCNAITEVSEILSPEDIYSERHRIIFGAMLEMHDAGANIDEVTLAAHLKSGGQLERVGGLAFLSELAQGTPTSAHARGYARIIREHARVRRMVQVVTAVAEQGLTGIPTQLVPNWLDGVEAQVMEVGDARTHSTGPVHARALLGQVTENLEQAFRDKRSVTGLETGYARLDDMTSGLQPEELIIVAARPSMGKTALALNITAHAALRCGVPALVISAEMSSKALVERLIGAEGSINMQDAKRGRMNQTDWSNYARAAESIARAPLWILDAGSPTLHQVRSTARRWKRTHNIGLLVIDYLQLMVHDDSEAENRTQEMGEISKGLKALAKELKIPVVALSQLNRSLESRSDKRPMMSDLRESGALEQDADVIAFLYRDEYYTREACEHPGTAEVIIAKQRNGPVGMVRLAWLKQYTRFAALASED